MEKIELAANNGNTLGEEVISIKRNKFRLGQQRKFQLRNNNKKSYKHHHLPYFPVMF